MNERMAGVMDTWMNVCMDEDMNVCKNIRFQKSWTQTIETIINETNETPALVDATGVGDVVVEDLQNRVDFIEDVDISEVEKPHGV